LAPTELSTQIVKEEILHYFNGEVAMSASQLISCHFSLPPSPMIAEEHEQPLRDPLRRMCPGEGMQRSRRLLKSWRRQEKFSSLMLNGLSFCAIVLLAIQLIRALMWSDLDQCHPSSF